MKAAMARLYLSTSFCNPGRSLCRSITIYTGSLVQGTVVPRKLDPTPNTEYALASVYSGLRARVDGKAAFQVG